jgi:hypothetical protein
MMDANKMTEAELMAQATVWYLDEKFELVKQIADHLESIGFDRMEVMKEIRNLG